MDTLLKKAREGDAGAFTALMQAQEQNLWRAARAILPPETKVWTSAISRESFSLCDKLLRLGGRAEKETEFYCIYRF